MNHYHRVFLALALSWCFLQHAAWGQAPASPLKDMKNAATIAAGQETTINNTVLGNFKKLMDGDAAARQAARNALIDDAQGAGPAFATKYAEAVNVAAIPVINSAKPLPVRLNAAIVVARVAEATKSPRLEPVMLVLLDDKQPYTLKLWGMKAAAPLLPEMVRQNSVQKTLARVVPVVQKHTTSSIAAEAYEALKQPHTAVIDQLLKVLELRVAVYTKGLAEDPTLEGPQFVYLAKGEIWNPIMTEPQRRKALEVACNLLVLAAYHGDGQLAGTPQREQLMSLLKTMVLPSLEIMGRHLANTPLQTEAAKAYKLMGGNSKLSELVKPVVAAIKKVKGCETLQEPKLTPPPSTMPVMPVY